MDQPDAGEIESLILLLLEPSGSATLATLSERVGLPTESILSSLTHLVQGGLVDQAGASVTLTETGRLVAAHVRESQPSTTVVSGPLAAIDLSEVVRFIGSRWPEQTERAAAQEQARNELLASDADRDEAVNLLSEAFAQGRLSSVEHEQRTSAALSARTYGELDEVLRGLGGMQHAVTRHPVRMGVFWAATVVTSPFLLIGTLLFAFGSDVGDHVGGLIFLVVLLPGLLALHRWAWPRPR